MKYRKKSLIIEAFCLGREVPDWFLKSVNQGQIVLQTDPLRCEIKTLEGTMVCHEGDYIIRGVFGEIYPCRGDIFEATYEEVN